MKTSRSSPSRLFGLTLLVLLVAVAVVWALASPRRRTTTTAEADANISMTSADPTTGPTPANPTPRNLAAANPAPEPPRPDAPAETQTLHRVTIAEAASIPTPRPRSPLERSPGYYPPDDPESMSVITGRREAPAVNLELTGGASSIDQLGRMLVAGINARDERALHALAVTRNEFEVICWREFPESRPVTNITAADAWEMSSIQSNAGVGRTVGAYGYSRLEFIRVDTGPPAPYRNFTLYRKVEIVTKDPATSQEVRLAFAPSFVERHGRYKVLTFKD